MKKLVKNGFTKQDDAGGHFLRKAGSEKSRKAFGELIGNPLLRPIFLIDLENHALEAVFNVRVVCLMDPPDRGGVYPGNRSLLYIN